LYEQIGSGLLPVPFDKLYPKQKKVIQHKAGPLLVLAGPGTGKTEVLTHRIAYLVNKHNINPKTILAITFSRKAAKEMAERLMDFEGFEENKPRISTIHAEALHLLSGLWDDKLFLLDNNETKWLIMDAARDIGLNLGARELKKLENEIAICKAKNLLPNEIPCINTRTNWLINLYKRYEELLSFNRAIDLNGLVMKTVRLLSSGDFVTKLEHICVDEYQDINESEFKFIQILAKNVTSLFVVGDDDQSIYGWRGANPNIIRRFSKDFPNGKEVLEESHRCTDHILQGAQAIVSKDPQYQPKPLYSVKGSGLPIRVLISKSWTVEALWIADWIQNSISKGLYEPQKIAILCKALKLADFLAEQLRINKLDYVYWRPSGLFTLDVIRDILAHVRLLVDKEDNFALRRCIRTATGRGLGETATYAIRKIAEKFSCSFWDSMVNANKHSKLQRWHNHINRFVSIVNELEEKSLDLELDKTLHLIAKEIGATNKRGVSKLEDFAKTLEPDTGLKELLSKVNKNRGLDLAGGTAEPEEEKPAVQIMSMHAAKGLTFDVVFILGMDEDIFPDSHQDLNEQRRLCYVAMTRAKKELFLCCAQARKGPPARGLSFYCPSRFVNDIPKKHKAYVVAR